MRIVNETYIRSTDLARFLKKGVAASYVSPEDIGIVTVKYHDQATDWAYGWAYDTGDVNLFIYRGMSLTPRNIRYIAQVWEHELDHVAGRDHKNMPPLCTLHVRWCSGCTLRLRSTSNK